VERGKKVGQKEDVPYEKSSGKPRKRVETNEREKIKMSVRVREIDRLAD
jgi:hypothetical protein